MPEPSSVAAATLTAIPTTIPMVIIFGVPLGLRPDMLIAGFFGSLVAIILLNSVPSEGDTWQHLLRSTFKRMFVALASSLTAGYLTPLALLIANVPDPLILSAAFAVGGGAQKVLVSTIIKFSTSATVPPNPPAHGGT